MGNIWKQLIQDPSHPGQQVGRTRNDRPHAEQAGGQFSRSRNRSPYASSRLLRRTAQRWQGFVQVRLKSREIILDSLLL